MRLELGRIEEPRTLPVGVDAKHLALVAGADEERAVRAGDERPDKRRRGLVHELGRGAEDQPAVRVD